VNFVNSVIGARAERLPDLMDVCCAVCGRVPEYGHYITENRRGDVLFRLEGFDETWFRDVVDYAILGYYVGEAVINRNPVIDGLPQNTGMDQLKAFSAAAASGGAICLFHAVGLTPEAPTVEDAFQGWDGYETAVVSPADLIEMKRKLDTAHRAKHEEMTIGAKLAEGHVDMVLIGCPHASFTEMQEISGLIQGKHVIYGTEFWITTSRTQYELAVRAGIADILKESGVTIACDTCVMEMEEGERWKHQIFVTNSGKVAQYAPGINHCFIKMATTAGCVEAAVTGRFPEEVH
jgi:predicted aconitase